MRFFILQGDKTTSKKLAFNMAGVNRLPGAAD
jgi:hypothetical protein